MDERKLAFLEAALMCSKFADNLRTDHPDWAKVAEECSKIIEDEADGDVHVYPPNIPVKSKYQVSENIPPYKTKK